MAPVHFGSVSLVILLSYTSISVLLLSGSTLASGSIATPSRETAMKVNAMEVGSSSSITTLQSPKLAGNFEPFQEGIRSNSDLRAMLHKELKTPGISPVENCFHPETTKTLNQGVIMRYDASRRALLRDISPPGMWPISDDQAKEYRRALLAASSPTAVSGLKRGRGLKFSQTIFHEGMQAKAPVTRVVSTDKRGRSGWHYCYMPLPHH